jgi:hypothetical protein
MATSKPEIGAFARTLILNGLDNLVEKVPAVEGEASPIQKLASYWRGMTPEEKSQLATEVTAVAGMAAAALPVALTAARKRVRRRIARKAAVTAVGDLPDKKKKKDKKDKKRKKKNKKDKKKKKK